jgi:hypothetical protein
MQKSLLLTATKSGHWFILENLAIIRDNAEFCDGNPL